MTTNDLLDLAAGLTQFLVLSIRSIISMEVAVADRGMLNVLFCSLIFMLIACRLPFTGTSTRECDGNLQSLLLNEEDFPSGWSRGTPVRDYLYPSGSIMQCAVNFTAYNTGAFQEVYTYKSEKDATQGYEHLLDIAFRINPEYETPWEVPSYPTLDDFVANDHFLACSRQGSELECRFLARHGAHVVLFHTDVVPQFMTRDNLEDILRAIDLEMTHFVDELKR